uniref:Uncharacterized protein n=1 Tax=Amphimedon queenslandica TaxID=400682 RepID=A0A1X7VR15_AMPQE
ILIHTHTHMLKAFKLVLYFEVPLDCEAVFGREVLSL